MEGYEQYAGRWRTLQVRGLLDFEHALSKIRALASKEVTPDKKKITESTWLGFESSKRAVLSPVTKTPTMHRYILPVRTEKGIRPLFCNVNIYA